MNRYLVVCRLRWPAMLLLTGVLALLNQADILSWGHSWPLYLILFGLLALAERALLAADPPPGYPYAGYPAGVNPGVPPQDFSAQGFSNQPYPNQPYANQPFTNPPAPGQSAAPAPPVSSTGIVPVSPDISLQRNRSEEER
jgi:hypothetical protein